MTEPLPANLAHFALGSHFVMMLVRLQIERLKEALIHGILAAFLQSCTHIQLAIRKQAGPQFAVGCQTKTVAFAAEMA